MPYEEKAVRCFLIKSKNSSLIQPVIFSDSDNGLYSSISRFCDIGGILDGTVESLFL